MKLLEYEAKSILKHSGVPVPSATLLSPNSKKLPPLPAVLKSQVPVGGRGKAGGVVVVKTEAQLRTAADKIFHLAIKGFTPQHLLAEALIDIKHEFYLSLVIDKPSASIRLMAHHHGGVEIESHDPDTFLTITLTGKNVGMVGEQLAEYFELPEQSFALQDLVDQLYDCFVRNDATLLEINPLVLTKQGKLVAGDCKMVLDDAAAFRHPDWRFEAPAVQANFVTLNHTGNVATIANGAGLAMATVDAVADAGLVPANFLDIGGGANTASVLTAFEKIMEYPDVRAIVINIFAGITRCDEVARAIIAAREQIDDLPPLSIRLAGTNFEAAVDLLAAEAIPVLATLEDCIATAKKEVRA
jgi:succinyl-CoA synthetase beta subunit